MGGVSFADETEEVVYVVNSNVHAPVIPDWAWVTMLRGSDLVILNTVIVGEGAHSVAITPDNKQIWVTCVRANNIAVIDAATLEILDIIDLGVTVHRPFGIAITPDGSRAYVTFEALGTVGIFDTETRAHLFPDIIVGGDPTYVVFTPDGSKAYVVNMQNPQVTAIRTSDNTVVATIPLGGHALQQAVVSPDGSLLYVCNMDLNQIEVIRTSDDTLLAPIFTITATPRGLGISPDGNYLFIGHRLGEPSIVNMFRLADNTIVSSAYVPSNPRRIAVRPDGSRIFVSEHDFDECYAYDVCGENLVLAEVADLNTEGDFHASPVGLAIGEIPLSPPVPTMNQWGIIAMITALGASVLLVLRRKTGNSGA
jgi:YVTN family beta-propeller protein